MTAICSAAARWPWSIAIAEVAADGVRIRFDVIGAVAAITIATAISVAFYDRFWYAPDDGAYAHVASRILQGEVLNGTVQDVHAGYVNFVNAAALALFGPDLTSLRIPLAVLNVLQALIVYLLLQRSGVWLALSASVAVSSLSFVQFLNPTAHWYCLFLVLLVPLVLTVMPRDGWPRFIALGLVMGLIATFRQLTGIIAAVAVLGWLILERSDSRGRAWETRLVLVVIALLIAAYVVRQADLATAVLFGAWPVALLLVAAWRANLALSAALRIAGGLALGMLLACLPLIVYHVYHGTLQSWIHDMVGAALAIPRFGFIEHQSYLSLATLAIPGLASWGNPAVALNALFWLFLIVTPAINGALLLRRALRSSLGVSGADALAWLACFYTLVALHYQIPIYLFYVAGLNAVALAALMSTAHARAAVGATLLAVSAVAVYFHAGQSLARGVDGTIHGERSAQLVPCGLPRCGLRLDPRDVHVHRELVSRIAAHSAQTDCILALPSDAELYFFTGRCNPTRFFNSALGLRRDAELDNLLSHLRTRPPAMLIHRPSDKYNTPLTQQLVARLAPLFRRHERVGDFILYWDTTEP